jgi:hypothetical protein
MNTITLQLSDYNSTEKSNLHIELYDNPAVKEWFNRFKFELISGSLLKKEHIFKGTSFLSIEQMIATVNNTLDTISSWDFVANQLPNYPVTEQPNISVRLKLEDFNDGPNNPLMNEVHNYFPTLSGPAHRTSNYMYAASPEIRMNICRLNLEVHELHTALQNTQQHGMSMCVTWQRAPKNLPALNNAFDELFVMDVEFGDVLLGYPQVGKTHFEAFIEEDTSLDPEHVEPIKVLSGDMLLHLDYSFSKDIIDNFNKWLVGQGLDPTDKSAKYGFAKLGKITNVSFDEIQNLKKFNDVSMITISENGIKSEYPFAYTRFDSDYNERWLRHVDD